MKRRVLVTGSSRGIGKAIALELAKSGFDIAVHFRSNREAAETVAREIEALGRSAWLLGFDVADRAGAVAAIEQDIEANGAYYGVVCNAGIHRDAAFPALTGEEWDEVVNVNLNGFFNVTQPTVMPMVRARKGGLIVVLSSVAGIMGNRGQVNYSATKAALIGATKSLAIELASRQITVNCVAPGVIETDMVDDVEMDRIKHLIPAGRMGRAEEVAGLVAYLFSDSAAYITRQVISVNGGMA